MSETGTQYSAYNSKGWKPSGASVARHYRAFLTYTVLDATDTDITITASMGVSIDYSVTANFTANLTIGDSSWSGTGKTVYDDAKKVTIIGDKTVAIPKTQLAQTIVISASVSSSKGSWTGEVVTTTKEVSLSALASYSVTYSGEGASGLPETQTKWFGIDLALSDVTPTKSGWEFLNWISGSTVYRSGQTYTDNASLSLTAQWSALNPPEIEYTYVGDTQGFTNPTKNFSSIKVTVTKAESYTGRTISSIVLKLGSQTSSAITGTGNITITPSTSGTFDLILVATDSLGAVSEYVVKTLSVTNPTWTRRIQSTDLLPDVKLDGYANIKIEAKNETTNAWDELTGNYTATGTNGNWHIDVVLTEDYIPSASRSSENASSTVRVTYNHSDSDEKEYRQAFFNTTRNANYSTGLAGNVFVSGCGNTNFSSRVWWCYVNNPLYFPDNNYVEVGSNDTQVMGLCKVGDYLGAVKQSKTTDTAIYLLYPTSFDDDTTYAVKQGVQGIGALGKYTFNILNDETLFLSPNGVMAIVPSEDEEHKVQNRSYYVDGKLLKEVNLKDSYSFVYDGMYYLAVDGRCYVLDGNQKNSYGNDKTNLVYEAYYLENIPAKCFMKYNDELWFSDEYNVCRFKTSNDNNAYTDDFNGESSNVPVKAEWSTILDDDGSLHYYKTMQKKGNVVSVFPNSSNTKVYIKKDEDEPVEIQRTFTETTDIPSELFVNKKFKKYKRLQFIIRNESNSAFGVDSIVKSYSLGSYAKR